MLTLLKSVRKGSKVMVYDYRPKGVCSQYMRFDVEEGVIRKVEILGGCSGNLQGLSSLLAGMTAQEAVSRLKGIRCGYKSTSCPDQMAQALELILAEAAKA